MARAAARQAKRAITPAEDTASVDTIPAKRNQPRRKAGKPVEIASTDQPPVPDTVVFDQPTAVAASDDVPAPSNDPIQTVSDAPPSDTPVVEARPTAGDSVEPPQKNRARASSRKVPAGSQTPSPPGARSTSRSGKAAADVSDPSPPSRETASTDPVPPMRDVTEKPARKAAAVRKEPATQEEDREAGAAPSGASPKRRAAKTTPEVAPRKAPRATAKSGRKAAPAAPAAAPSETPASKAAGSRPGKARSVRAKPVSEAANRAESAGIKAPVAKTVGSVTAASRKAASKASAPARSVTASPTRGSSRTRPAAPSATGGSPKGKLAATNKKTEMAVAVAAAPRSAPKSTARAKAATARTAPKPGVPAKVAGAVKPVVTPGRSAASTGRGAARPMPSRAAAKASTVATTRLNARRAKASAPRVAAKDPKIEASELQLGYLSGYVGFHLRLAQDASYRAFARHSDRETVKPGRFPALAIISLNPGISQSALGRAIARDKSTVSPLIKDLQSNGFISRKPSPYDRRSVTLSLTKKGERILEKLQVRAKEHEEEILALIGSSKDRLMAVLKKIIGGMNT